MRSNPRMVSGRAQGKLDRFHIWSGLYLAYQGRKRRGTTSNRKRIVALLVAVTKSVGVHDAKGEIVHAKD
jgi:DNA topoisomerase IB